MDTLSKSRIRDRWLLVAGALAGVAVAATFFAVTSIPFLDRTGNPICHKQLYGVIQNWQEKHSTRDFPNVDGDRVASVAAVKELANYPELKSHYSYVPGLSREDPGDLVLFYIDRPTRWTLHGSPPLIITSKKWILVPVDMKIHGSRSDTGPGELSERVSFDEFRKRLRKTLDYIKTKQRPNWETVVKQHTEFLDRTEKMLAGTK